MRINKFSDKFFLNNSYKATLNQNSLVWFLLFIINIAIFKNEKFQKENSLI